MKERSLWGNQATNVSNNRQKAESTVILNVGAESTVAESPQNENVRVPRSPARIPQNENVPRCVGKNGSVLSLITMCWKIKFEKVDMKELEKKV
jgi:hypothetical protein